MIHNGRKVKKITVFATSNGNVPARSANIKETTDILIRISHENGKDYEYVIVMDLAMADKKERRLHYTEPLARELLTALFRPENNRKGNYNNHKFIINWANYGDREHVAELKHVLIPNNLMIRENGGTTSSLKNKYMSLVDLLLYSPYTKRYEMLKATYDSRAEKVYTAPWRFRNFVENYGNPQLKLSFYSNGKSVTDISEYNAESLLMLYGYSTARDTDEAEKRHEILAEIIDLGILSKKRIISYLEFFINTHPSDKYLSAREKWINDKRYIEKYNVNKTRFLIRDSK